MNIGNELDKFYSIFKYHAKTETRKAFYSYTSRAMNEKSHLYKYYKAVSNVLHEIQTDEETLYEQAHDCISSLTEQTFDSIEELEDYDLYEGIDSSVNVYTSDLTAWLARSNYNPSYMEEAVSTYGAESSSEILMSAQYSCHSEIWNGVRTAIVDFLRDKE